MKCKNQWMKVRKRMEEKEEEVEVNLHKSVGCGLMKQQLAAICNKYITKCLCCSLFLLSHIIISYCFFIKNAISSVWNLSYPKSSLLINLNCKAFYLYGIKDGMEEWEKMDLNRKLNCCSFLPLFSCSSTGRIEAKSSQVRI